jgi:hypothetical protein
MLKISVSTFTRPHGLLRIAVSGKEAASYMFSRACTCVLAPFQCLTVAVGCILQRTFAARLTRGFALDVTLTVGSLLSVPGTVFQLSAFRYYLQPAEPTLRLRPGMHT